MGDHVPGIGEIVTLLTAALGGRNSSSFVKAATFGLSAVAAALAATAMQIQGDVPWSELDLIAAARALLLSIDIRDLSGFEAAVVWLERDQLTALALIACLVAACVAIRWKSGGIAIAWTLIALAGANLGSGQALLIGLAVHSTVYLILVIASLAERVETRTDPWHQARWQAVDKTFAQWVSQAVMFVFFPFYWLGSIAGGIRSQFILDPLPRPVATGAVPIKRMPPPSLPFVYAAPERLD